MRHPIASLALYTLSACARPEATPLNPTHSAPTHSAPAHSAPARARATEPPASAAAPPLSVRVTNRGGLRGLQSALNDVSHIELLRWDPRPTLETLSPIDQTLFVQLIREGQLTDTRTVAHAPWPVAILVHTRELESYAVTLVGHSTLRVASGRADGIFEGAFASWNSRPPPELALADEGWLWHYLEARLGPTREKEYLMQRAPDYLELPHKP